MMPNETLNKTALRGAVYDVTERFLVGDASTLASELTESLIVASARVGLMRRSVENTPGGEDGADGLHTDLRAIEAAFGRSVDLARRLSQAIRSQRAPGAYTAVANVARELARCLTSALPEAASLSLRCPSGPVLAAIPQPEFRRILVVVVRGVLESVGERGELLLEVTEGKPIDQEVRVVIGHARLRQATAAEAAERARELVQACDGSIDAIARTSGGTAVVVLLPRAG